MHVNLFLVNICEGKVFYVNVFLFEYMFIYVMVMYFFCECMYLYLQVCMYLYVFEGILSQASGIYQKSFIKFQFFFNI